MPEGIPGYLRYRLVNPRGSISLFNDGFESPSSAVNYSLWTTIGTNATGTLTYWATDAGSPSIASNVVTLAAGAKMHGGHLEWADMEFICRFTYNSGGHQEFIVHFTDVNNFIYADVTTNAFNLRKIVAGVDTSVFTQAPTLTNGNVYWAHVICTGTNYAVKLFNDSAGAQGTLVAGSSASGTVSNAILQSGYVGLWSVTVSTTYGGAFSDVCVVKQNASYPSGWAPVVFAGEPAFAQSSVNPQAGTYSASIESANSAASGAWQQTTTIPATPTGLQYQLSYYIRATGGAATVTAGGFNFVVAPTTDVWTNTIITGAMTANPIVSCNLSAGAGRAHYDAISIQSQGLVITDDLPHPHQSTWQIRAMQPGSPSNSALGNFTIPLYPPGSEQYAAAKTIYDQIDYFLRVEGYLGYDPASIGLGKLAYAGIIDEIDKEYGTSNRFEIRGQTDPMLANLSRPFPGELLSNDVTSVLVKSYLGGNELGFIDNFTPFTSGNYTSAALPTNSAGTWSGTTDDGLNVVSCATGSGAVLISKSGGTANDRWHSHFVEMTGRLNPTSDASNAGQVGIGISSSSANVNNSVNARLTSRVQNGRRNFDVSLVVYSGGVGTVAVTQQNALINVDDPSGFIPLTLGLLVTLGGNGTGTATATVTVNGKVILGQVPTGYDPGTGVQYPFLQYGTATTGTATCYLTNLIQMTRFTTDGPSTAALFGNGTLSTTTTSLAFGFDPGATFLEAWTRLATRNGYYWRYNPQPYAVGTRTIGTVDVAAAPGTDLSSSIIFDRAAGNLLGLQLSANADYLVADTAAIGQPSLDGGGIAYWRDIGTLTKYGPVQDETLAFTNPDFGSLRRAAYQVMINKLNVGTSGAKTATVLRDSTTVDKWRELDRVTIHDPEMNILHLSSLVLGYDFGEGLASETIYLDQFSNELAV